MDTAVIQNLELSLIQRITVYHIAIGHFVFSLVN